MSIAQRVALGVLVCGSLLLMPGAGSVAAADKKSVDVIILKIKVETTKKDGTAWDAGGGAPDLKVFIRKDRGFDKGMTTPVKQNNVFEVEFNAKTIRVEEGDTIEIIVYDEDVSGDDTVGTYKKKITADTLKERVVDWKFDRVISLKIKFEP